MEEIIDCANGALTSDRRLVTFALFTYNQERYVAEAVRGALSQTYSPLEIIISDDGSSDGTFEVVQEMVRQYQGPHEIRLNRNVKNIGVNRHVNLVCSQLAKGGLIVVQAGDDISEPSRVSETVGVWLAQNSSAICCNAMLIDSDGQCIRAWRLCNDSSEESIKPDLDSRNYSEIAFYGAGAAYDARVFKDFEPLPGHLRNEDYILAWRAAITGGISYMSQQLLRYRKHDSNLSIWTKIEGDYPLVKRLLAMRSAWLNVLVNREYVYEHVLKDRFSDKALTKACYEAILVDRMVMVLMREEGVRKRVDMIEVVRDSNFRVLLRLSRVIASLLKQIFCLIFLR